MSHRGTYKHSNWLSGALVGVRGSDFIGHEPFFARAEDLKAQLDALTKKVNGDDSTAKAAAASAWGVDRTPSGRSRVLFSGPEAEATDNTNN